MPSNLILLFSVIQRHVLFGLVLGTEMILTPSSVGWGTEKCLLLTCA